VATVVGLILVVCGITVLAVVRPWHDSPDDDDDPPPPPPSPGRMPSPSPVSRAKLGPRPQPPSPGSPPSRRRVGRRVPAEPGRPEIPLPEWLSN